MNFTQKQYRVAVDSLNPPLKQTLFSEETSSALARIYNKYSVEKGAHMVSAIVGYILVGLLPIKKFIQALEEEAGIDKETAYAVAHDIREEIFAPVAQDLAQIQEKAEQAWEKSIKNPPKQNKGPAAKRSAPDASGASAPDESVIREVPASNEPSTPGTAASPSPEKKRGNSSQPNEKQTPPAPPSNLPGVEGGASSDKRLEDEIFPNPPTQDEGVARPESAENKPNNSSDKSGPSDIPPDNQVNLRDPRF